MDGSAQQPPHLMPRASIHLQDASYDQESIYQSGHPAITSYPQDTPPQAHQLPQPSARRPQLPNLLHPTRAQLDMYDGIPPDQARDQQQPALSQPRQQRPELPRDYSLAPKPKPGRKPATDIPADKRKASNREAQRKFRERRRKKLEEALEALDKERTNRIRQEAEFARDLEERDQIARYGYLPRHEYHRSLTGQPVIPPPLIQPNKGGYKPPRIMPQRDVQDRLQDYRIPPPLEVPNRPSNSGDYGILTPTSGRSSNTSAISPGTILPLPKRESSSTPEHSFRPNSQDGRTRGSMHSTNSSSRLRRTESSSATTYSQPSSSHSSSNAMEVDFTNLGRGLTPPASPVMVHDDPCGFCVDGSYCPCKEDALNAQRAATAAASRSRLQATMEPTTSATGPGSCDACLNDPQRRAMCMDMASRSINPDRTLPMSSYDETTATGPASQSTTLPPINHLLSRASPEGDSYMTCQDAINLTRERLPHLARDPRSYVAFVNSLRTVTPARAACTTCPATEVHSHLDVEVASILEGMSRAGGGGSSGNGAKIEGEGDAKVWGRERDSGYDSHRGSGG